MKKILSILLTIVLVISTFSSAFAETEIIASGDCSKAKDGSVTWELDSGGTLTISGSGNIFVYQLQYGFPSKVDTPWDDYYKDIKRIVINEGITQIGDYAFSNCSSAESVSIPDSVTRIGLYAFLNCSGLKNVTLSENITYVGTYNAFAGCTSLTEINVHNQNQNFQSKNGILYNKDGRNLVAFPNQANYSESIFEGVTQIHGAAFRGNTTIENLNVPGNVKSIGDYAFYYAEGVKKVMLNEGFKSFGPNWGHSFSYCSSLEEIVIPSTCGEYPDLVGCTNLKKVTHLGNPTSMVSLTGCKSLLEFVMPKTITSAEDFTFMNCENLRNIQLSPNLKSILSGMFYNCSSLEHIYLPESIIKINTNAFSGCTNLKSIVIPNTVASIGTNAFNNCENLETIYYLGTQDEWNAISITSSGNSVLTGVDVVSYIAPTSITLNKTESILYAGKNFTLVADLQPENATDKTIVWTSDNESVAVVKNGIVYGISPGIANITATTVDYKLSASCVVTVKDAPKESVVAPLSNVPSGLINSGDKVTLYTSTLGADIYYTIDGSIPTTKSSKYTGAITLKQSSLIKAIAIREDLNDSEITTYEYTVADLTTPFVRVETDSIANKGDLISVSVSISENSNSAGGSFNLKYDNTILDLVSTTTGNYCAPANPFVNEQYADDAVRMVWSGVNELNNSGTLLSAQFRVLSNAKSLCKFELSNVKLGDSSGNKKTVQTASGNLIVAAKIAAVTNDATNIEKTSVTLSGSITADVENIERYICYWDTSDPETVYKTNVLYGEGEYSVDISDLKANTEYQYQMTKEGPVKTFKTLSDEIETISVNGVTLSDNSLTMEKGDERTLTANITPLNATNTNVSWYSSNATVASVANGKVEAISPGKTSIIVTTEDGNFVAICDVVVLEPTISTTDITLDASELELVKGMSYVLTASVYPENASDKSVVWETSDSSVVMVSNGILTALSKGNAVITASTKDGNHTATCNINVIEAAVQEKVKEPTASIADGYIARGTNLYLSTETKGAKIYYTVDGSQPSATNGTLYNSQITITEDTTIKAIAIKDNMADSKVSQFTYTIIGEDTPTIQVESIKGKAGKTVDVKISLKNNPGIATMRLDVNYDKDIMELVGVSDAGTMTGQVHSTDYTLYPYSLYWENGTITENIVVNDTIATLSFAIKENVDAGSYPITVSYDMDNYDVFNVDLEPVEFVTAPGQITIGSYIYGDVDDNGKVNALDSVIMARYIAKWPNTSVNLEAADVNADGKVNALDSVILKRHVAKWPAYLILPY